MHNLDQTLNVHETEYEFTFPQGSQYEQESETEYESEAEAFGEMEQLELAAELLEVANEQELENFLGNLISKAGSAISNFAKSSTGQALGGILKSAAKQALPIAGGALGGFIGGPIGAKLGSMAADKAGQLFGLELEGLSHEDREFEVAQQFVRLAGDAARNAAAAHGTAPPASVAKEAFVQSAQTLAPGLIRPARNGSDGGGKGSPASASSSQAPSGRRRGGQWRRHGSNIILFGV